MLKPFRAAPVQLHSWNWSAAATAGGVPPRKALLDATQLIFKSLRNFRAAARPCCHLTPGCFSAQLCCFFLRAGQVWRGVFVSWGRPSPAPCRCFTTCRSPFGLLFWNASAAVPPPGCRASWYTPAATCAELGGSPRLLRKIMCNFNVFFADGPE